MINISDDEDVDHPHTFDDDKEQDGNSRVMEMKLVIAPSTIIVKVEKDSWANRCREAQEKDCTPNNKGQ